MLKRDFYSYDAFQEAVGVDDEAIRQALIRGELKAYLEPKSELGRLLFLSGTAGVGPTDGSNKYCSWRARNPPFPRSQYFYYALSGWFRVEKESLKEAARQGAFVAPPRLIPPMEQDGLLSDGDVFELSVEEPREYEGSFWIDEEAHFLPTIKALWFDAETVETNRPKASVARDFVNALNAAKAANVRADSQAMPSQSVGDKPLDSRERRTLLRIIRALDAMAKLPGRGAAVSVEKQLQTMGFNAPKDAIIRKWIEEARNLEPDENTQ